MSGVLVTEKYRLPRYIVVRTYTVVLTSVSEATRKHRGYCSETSDRADPKDLLIGHGSSDGAVVIDFTKST